MTLLIITTVLVGLAVSGAVLFWQINRWGVIEDHMAVTMDRDGFIRRVLPPGRHMLRPFEKIAFVLETKTKLTTDQVRSVVTGDGISVNFNWSGLYAVDPALITEDRSQRLRNLPNAEKAIGRNVDIYLRKLIGNQRLQDLFDPQLRERLERQLNRVITDRLKGAGIVFKGLNVQVIELPQEVAEALNKAKAIETLDGAIRHLDPTTREVVRGVYQLDEVLHWDSYLPVPSRLTMKRTEAMAH